MDPTHVPTEGQDRGRSHVTGTALSFPVSHNSSKDPYRLPPKDIYGSGSPRYPLIFPRDPNDFHAPYEDYRYNTSSPSNNFWTSFDDTSSATRWTPSSLGWAPDTELLKLYQFVVKHWQEPYFELLPQWTSTYETPRKVYLDRPKSHEKHSYPCQYPGTCPFNDSWKKGKGFSTPSDLERHYKNVHAEADQKDSFPCDYSKCARSIDCFTRKDHYRTHLRNFHKEDIGGAGQMIFKNSWRHKPEFIEKFRDNWLAERRIHSQHWRCAKCLLKVVVAVHGWKCPQCQKECEDERKKGRLALALAAEREKIKEPRRSRRIRKTKMKTSIMPHP